MNSTFAGLKDAKIHCLLLGTNVKSVTRAAIVRLDASVKRNTAMEIAEFSSVECVLTLADVGLTSI